MPKPCDHCGAWIERLKDGRAYNDNGTWHEIQNGTCKPDVRYMRRRRISKTDFAAKHMKVEEDRRESRPLKSLWDAKRES